MQTTDPFGPSACATVPSMDIPPKQAHPLTNPSLKLALRMRMISIGSFLFRYRNSLFPVIYALLLFKSQPVIHDYCIMAWLGFLVAATGQLLRAITSGLEYVFLGGRNGQPFAEELKTGGIFAHCRNPLYVGDFLILLGIGITANSLLFLSLAMPFFAFAYSAMIAAEENYLRSKFKEEFDHYCTRVNRLVPTFSGLSQTLARMRFKWRQLISVEYGSTFLWLTAVILVTLKNIWLRGQYQNSFGYVVCLWGALAVVTFGYALVRFLKKRGNILSEH